MGQSPKRRIGLFHGSQPLWELARKLPPNDEVQHKRWIRAQQSRLDRSKIETLVLELRSIHAPTPDADEEPRTETEYFQISAERLRYLQLRKQYLFVGSGVIVVGCKSVIGSRLKRSGMCRTTRRANTILALRCCLRDGRFDDSWQARWAE